MKNLLEKILIATVVLTGSFAFSETVVYSDSFDGSARKPLNECLPNTTPEGTCWESMKNGTVWMADGSIGTQAPNQNRNAFLPFIPESGKVYELSLEMSPEGPVAGDFFSLGFASNNKLSDAFVTNQGMAVSPWMFVAASGLVRTYTGPGNKGNVAAVSPDGGWANPIAVKIILDTDSEPWAAEWFVNGESIRKHKFYTGNPEISYVTFGRFRRASGSVDNFKLSVLSE